MKISHIIFFISIISFAKSNEIIDYNQFFLNKLKQRNIEKYFDIPINIFSQKISSEIQEMQGIEENRLNNMFILCVNELIKTEMYSRYMSIRNDYFKVNELVKKTDIAIRGHKELLLFISIDAFILNKNRYPLRFLGDNINNLYFPIAELLQNFQSLEKEDKEWIVNLFVELGINQLNNININYFKGDIENKNKSENYKSSGRATLVFDSVVFCYLYEQDWDNIKIEEEFKKSKTTNLLKRAIVYAANKTFQIDCYFEIFNDFSNEFKQIKLLFYDIHPKLTMFIKKLNNNLLLQK